MSNDKFRILCTSTIPDSLMALAGESAIRIDVKELIQIKHLPDESLMGIENMHRVFHEDKVLVFTSAQAIKVLQQHYTNQYIHRFEPGGQRICCISGKTRQEAEKAFPGCSILAEAPYGQNLALAIIALGIREVEFFCSNIRRDELPDTLQAAGVTVHEHVIYETVPAPLVTATSYDGILFFSPSGVKSYLSANQLDPKTICFAIGETTAATLREHTNNKIIISTGTDKASTVKTAILYFNNINCYE
ncbi:uroporphyrinogen-III synthase [Chitinophaga sp. 30R24]|uniref:uroporphyrinogen-III synthase n=1 Tax=Chitinophaga sp. 30R24 TaxID=3248838 RepID=UPI003B921474